MALRFRSASSWGGQRQQATLLVVALLVGGVLMFKYVGQTFGGTYVTLAATPQVRHLVTSLLP